MSPFQVFVMMAGIAAIIGIVGLMGQSGEQMPPLRCVCSCDGDAAVLEITADEGDNGESTR